jgi:hypothetical protein
MTSPIATARVFERNDRVVIEAFQRGEFDFLEGVGEIAETDFFRAIAEKKVLEKLADTYPSPCKKHDVPLWVYIAGDISMRFHGVHQFHAFPYVVRSGGMVNAFGPAMGHKVTHPQTGDVTLCCEGFNSKNDYNRQTPCDQDYLRKMAKRTEAASLMQWFNRDVVGIFKQRHAFDPEGIFIGDASYLFVPDNDKYEGSSRLLFDEHNHPVDRKKVSPQRGLYTWHRCYKMISLIHTNRRAEFFLYAGIVVTAGKDHECPILYDLVEQFVGFHGKGTLKKLILDRGFLDGPHIGRCKQQWGIDVLIPARRDMDIYQDVVGLARKGQVAFAPWTPPAQHPQPIPLHRPERIKKREEARQRTLARRAEAVPALLRSEVAVVKAVETFTTCPVPLDVIVNKEVCADGSEDYWVLLSTASISDPALGRKDYALRTAIEERHRQLKCFSDLESFTSRSFSLIVNQVVFVLLTYSLLQWYLLRIGRRELNTKTRTRTLELLRPAITMVLIYYKSYVAYVSPLEHQELVLTLNEQARKKILAKTRKLRKSLANQLTNPRAP